MEREITVDEVAARMRAGERLIKLVHAGVVLGEPGTPNCTDVPAVVVRRLERAGVVLPMRARWGQYQLGDA